MNERIKEIRKALNMTQQEFADKLKTSRNNIGGYEAGVRTPSDAAINNICMVYNVNRDYLLKGEGPMFQEVSKENQLMMWAGKILWNQDDNFKRRFVTMLSVLDESDWETLEKIATLLAKKD